MNRTWKGVTGLLFAVVLAGCATKGELRSAVDEQRRALDEQRMALESERAERIAADERLARDLAALRGDLEELRSEFGARITAMEEGIMFALPVHFAFDDATVRERFFPLLDRFAAIVSRHYTGAVVTVAGFADPAGPAAYNRRLSQRRAEAVRAYLVDQGVMAEIRAVGHGAQHQVVPGAQKDDTGAELNRRVVFIVESPPGAGTTALEITTD